jgi:hypothetical protein
MTCDIFIRSYAKDFEWLGYCLASIAKYCRGFRRVVLAVPRSSLAALGRLPPAPLEIDLRECPNFRDDYLGQQVTKLTADVQTDADLICHVDSDCVFHRSTTPQDLLADGRPRILMRPCRLLARDHPWSAPTEQFLGWPVEHDFMRHPPFTYPRWIYAEVRAHAFRRHGVDIGTYVTRQPPRGFSEFNVLGAYAYRYHRAQFAWVDTSRDDAGAPLCHWYWSWGGLDASRRAQIEFHLGARSAYPT